MLLGTPATLQMVVSVAVLTVIIQGFSQRKSNEHELGKEYGMLDLRLALLAAGSLLTTPHSLSYDTPLLMLSAATALLISPYAEPLAIGGHIPFAFLAPLLWFGVLYRRFSKRKATNPLACKA